MKNCAYKHNACGEDEAGNNGPAAEFGAAAGNSWEKSYRHHQRQKPFAKDMLSYLLMGLGFGALVVQGIATSIDALSVGFTIAGYGLGEAIIAALLIAVVTFFICMGGILIGRKVGTCLAGKAGILGGAILIFIGLEIFITSWF